MLQIPGFSATNSTSTLFSFFSLTQSDYEDDEHSDVDYYNVYADADDEEDDDFVIEKEKIKLGNKK